MFQTRRPSYCWIEFTTDSLLAAHGDAAPQKARSLIGGQVICHDIEQKIRLNDLKEGTTYYYRVCAQELLENRAYFKAFGDTIRTPYYRFTLPASDTDDFTAIAAYRDLAAAGLYVGKNISVTGFDGVSIGSMVSPHLTTIRQDASCIGDRAAELLAGLIDGCKISEGMERLDFTLVKGGLLMVTYADLFTYSLVIIGIVGLVLGANKKK